jgi:spore coat polysaccharide biosynthesis protein SpsF (cytidylyltransferase family)
MNISAIIQARCNSTRLKNKVLADIDGKPLIGRIVDRVKQSEMIDRVIIATTTSPHDDSLMEWCKHNGIEGFRGSEFNVLERYYQCAMFYKSNIVVRITADDPFKDPVIIDYAINKLIEGNYDYVSNTIKPTFPEGIDVEVYRFRALELAFKNATLNSEKEHVTPYIWKNNKFALLNFENEEDLSDLRWTIDYSEDLEFARAVYKKMRNKKKHFLMKDILDLLGEHPELSIIQKDVVRNEGYIGSVEND